MCGLLGSVLGITILAQAQNLVSFFIGLELATRAGFYDAAEFEENMSTHYGKMIHMDDRTVMFGSLEEAAAFIGDMLPPEVARKAIDAIEARFTETGSMRELVLAIIQSDAFRYLDISEETP